ncbi:division/cell wall cluster transcriptional repressor MraZ [Patescibacteria group bacterium]|nr:division/cell wall cluster transcriptional repressor MraZ [Patescibacteria group bacterium]
MLIGEYTHTIDPKKRVSLPAKFRKEIGKKVIITNGLDNCLSVYTPAEWKKVSEKLSQLSMGQADQRSFNRFMLAGAVEIDIDSVGRMLIPDFLREFANLKTKVVLTGVHSHLEVWDEKSWRAYKKRIESQADVLAEKLGEIGVI